jgi:hypothetical protein
MPELHANPLSRGADLAVLIDLEARWENLRATRTSATPYSLQELQRNQRAYDLFHTKLVAYNKRYTPRHIPELLINTSVRLEHWCKQLGGLFAALDDQVPFPAHLLEKAYRLADAIATRTNRACASRPAPGDVRSAARELEMLAVWCTDSLAVIDAAR